MQPSSADRAMYPRQQKLLLVVKEKRQVSVRIPGYEGAVASKGRCTSEWEAVLGEMRLEGVLQSYV